MSQENPFAWLSRTELLVGRQALESLATKHVLVVGMGGVGSFAAEFICRSGVGNLTIADGDTVDISNCNRQLPALQTTVGKLKTDVMRDRLMAINPGLNLTVVPTFLKPDEMETLVATGGFDYVVDCIDSVTPKLYLITTALKYNIPLMSSMGAGGRFDPTQLHIADIFDSYNCPFAFYIRKRLRKMGIRQGFPVVFSSELPRRESIMRTDGNNFKRSAYGTMSWVPAAFGGACASVVVRNLIGETVLLKESSTG